MFHKVQTSLQALVVVILSLSVLTALADAQNDDLPPQYKEMQSRLALGWNTWDTNSVFDHVLLPQGLAIQVGLKHNSWTNSDEFLRAGNIALTGKDDPHIHVLHHSYDGSYTSLEVVWDGHLTKIESAHAGPDLVLLVTPLSSTDVSGLPLTAVFSLGYLWNRPGSVRRSNESAVATSPEGEVHLYLTGQATAPVNIPVSVPYLAATLTGPAGISTGQPRTLEQIKAIVARGFVEYERSLRAIGSNVRLIDALVSTVGWDTIYDPENRRVIVPSSRDWDVDWGGYALFEWDTYLNAPIAAIGSRDLAYADVIEMSREITRNGLVPNFARGGEIKSEGRSEPPVGSLVAFDLYRRFHDRWFLDAAYPFLLRWNRWWAEARTMDGYLVWGDDGQPQSVANGGAGTRQGAIYESGLDNSPMYDDVPFDRKTHRLEMADVGLMALYVEDCHALARIADVLGKTSDARELRSRERKYHDKLATLWNPQNGIFENKNLVTGAFSTRISPTNFYPLLGRSATTQQAEKMVTQHLLNPNEFWGQWVIPSISRADPAFRDQNYWRGRIWGPMNYLVGRGLDDYDTPVIRSARRQLGQKSARLFLQEWEQNGHVHENYNAITGQGDDVDNSNDFYTWGALLGLLGLQQ